MLHISNKFEAKQQEIPLKTADRLPSSKDEPSNIKLKILFRSKTTSEEAITKANTDAASRRNSYKVSLKLQDHSKARRNSDIFKSFTRSSTDDNLFYRLSEEFVKRPRINTWEAKPHSGKLEPVTITFNNPKPLIEDLENPHGGQGLFDLSSEMGLFAN